MLGVLPLVPTYGRVYKSKREVQEAFESGKDFRAANGQACGIGEIRQLGLAHCTFRYGVRLEKSCRLEVPQ